MGCADVSGYSTCLGCPRPAPLCWETLPKYSFSDMPIIMCHTIYTEEWPNCHFCGTELKKISSPPDAVKFLAASYVSGASVRIHLTRSKRPDGAHESSLEASKFLDIPPNQNSPAFIVFYFSTSDTP